MRPKVSVIIPIYNVEKYLERSVGAARNQTLKDIEIVLVDDESPDNCPVMCDQYKLEDDRIKVIHKKNGGLGFARNSGLEVASGEYLFFMDSDDYIDLDTLEIMYNAAVMHDADFVRVDNYREKLDGTILNKSYTPPMREGVYDQKELREKLLFPQFGMGPDESGDKYVSCSVWRNLYKKEIIDTYNLRFVSERELISEDIPFNLDFMIKAQRAYVINRKFYHYIVNDQSLTQSYKKDRFDKELELYRGLLERLIKYGVYDECEIRMRRFLITRARKSIRRELIGNPNRIDAIRNVNCILSKPELRFVLENYDGSKLPIKYKMVFYAMKYKMSIVLFMIRNSL
ncbi:MAG: glycosyltransferase [Clostridia bacterium]|nr:glycosyltransferase [Clostridia bacterium]